MVNKEFDPVIKEFFGRTGGEVAEIGSGHIHDSFRLTLPGKPAQPNHYFLQRINLSVFKHPTEMMENICQITEHIRTKMLRERERDIERKVLSVQYTLSGNPYFHEKRDLAWRVYRFIDRSYTVDTTGSIDLLQSVAALYGRFLYQLSDLPPDSIHQTIPDFHSSESRLAQFDAACQKDAFNRSAIAKAEIRFIRDNQQVFSQIQQVIAKDQLPVRVCHNDTKLNNVMIDQATDIPICVVDLDTVMPGYSIFDFGDLIRSALTIRPEDSTDPSEIRIDPARFEAICNGYLSHSRPILTATEIGHFIPGSLYIILMIGMRFLTDYLSGDHYFKTTTEHQNLDRCRYHFKLFEAVSRKRADLERIVSNLI